MKNDINESKKDLAIGNILDLMAEETDPEKLQQLSKSIRDLEDGRNDRMKIVLEDDNNTLRRETEQKEREEDIKRANKQTKLDNGFKIADLVIALIGLGGVIGLFEKHRREENESYPQNKDSDRDAKQIFEWAWKKKR